MKRILSLILFLAAIMLSASATADPSTNKPSVLLAWDISTDPMVNGYKVYWGVGTRQYTNSVVIVGRTNTYAAVSNLVRSTTYYFAATCTATNGIESDYSLEVSYATSPLPPYPFNLRASTLTPYSSFHQLAQGDVTRFDSVGRLGVHEALTFLVFEKERLELERKQIDTLKK